MIRFRHRSEYINDKNVIIMSEISISKRPNAFFTMVLIFLLSTLTLVVFAELKLIEADGYSIMGDGPEENPVVAQERARNAAKRAASEKAGVFIESMSEVRAGQLTKDAVRTISANIVEVKSAPITVEILGGVAVKYNCHITVVVDTDIVLAQLNKSKDKIEDAIKLNKDQEEYTAKNDAELAELKEKFKTATEPERQVINKEVKRNEEKFTATQLHADGVNRYQLDDLDGATKFFNQAIAVDPLYSAPWTSLGWIHFDRGQYDEAIKCFQHAIDLYDEFAPSWNGMGCSYNYKGTNENRPDYYQKAIEFCRRAIELDRNYAAPWNNLGYSYDKLKDYDRAIECFKKGIELDPNDPAPWSNMGNVYEHLGNSEKAIECYEKALAIKNDYAKAWNNFGYALSRKGDFDKAFECFTKATQYDDNYAEPWNGLGYVYNFKKDYKKAAECCHKAIKIDPNYANAWNNLGYAYGGQGNFKKSYEAYKKAVELDPDVEAYKTNLENAQKRL